jgi:hypothetical protein
MNCVEVDSVDSVDSTNRGGYRWGELSRRTVHLMEISEDTSSTEMPGGGYELTAQT